MKASKSLFTLGLALACAVITLSLAACAQAQDLTFVARFSGTQPSDTGAMQATDGKFYGLTGGGAYGLGVSSRMTPTGELASSQTALGSGYVNINFSVIAVNNSGEGIGLAGLASVIVREPDGSTTTFTVPGAAAVQPVAISNTGAVVGWFYDAAGLLHGFLYDSAGTITILDAPGAGTQLRSGTVADSINDTGEVSGHYLDDNGRTHGFVRDTGGSYSTFTPNESVYLAISVLSQNGEACGWYQDATSLGVGYVRDVSGRITSYSVPGSTWTRSAGINTSGQITGIYDLEPGGQKGFIRNADGSFVSFELPGAKTFPAVIVGIADNGDVVGYYGSGGFHGFQRSADTGIIATFDDPDAEHIHFDGTFPQSVSGNETIGGNFSNANSGSNTGFILR
jgi:probable HAF family extracellular repeat protein